MSYNIFYDKQFIRAGDRIIPMILAGSSNCFESSSGKRSRDWQVSRYVCDNKIMATEAEILTKVEDIRASLVSYHPDYTDVNFGSYDSIAIGSSRWEKTTYQMFKNFYKRGIANAMTIEELLTEHVSVEISVPYYYRKEGRVYPESVVFTSTEHMLKVIAFWEEILPDGFRVAFTNRYEIESFKERKKQTRRKNKTPKKEIMSDTFYALKFKERVGYFIKNTATKIVYHTHSDNWKVRKSLSKSDLEKYHSKMANKDKFEVVEIKLGRQIAV